MRALLLVGVGGFVGAILRYSVSLALARFGRAEARGVPLATLLVNVLGCLAIGWLLARLARAADVGRGEDVRLLVGVGLLGAFTTFSTFGNETLELLRAGEPRAALLNVGLQLGLGLAAVWLGLRLGAPAA